MCLYVQWYLSTLGHQKYYGSNILNHCLLYVEKFQDCSHQQVYVSNLKKKIKKKINGKKKEKKKNKVSLQEKKKEKVNQIS